jgi:DNA-binding FrmR family transcriptional regulator
MKHESHPDIIKRLRRARGQLDAVLVMLEKNRDCVLIAQQLFALERAINSAKRTLIHDHIDHCLSEDARAHSHGGSRHAHPHPATVREFKEITKYL